MNAVHWLVAVTGTLIALVCAGLASEEVRARLDTLPFAILRLARARLPAGLRERIHDQEWVPELEHILKHAELFPLTRLLTGIRYAAGLLMRAGSVADELLPPGSRAPASGGKPDRRRVGAWSADALHALVWPRHERIHVRLYVAGMTAAASVAIGMAGTSTTVRARDLELFTILVVSGVAASRRPLTTGGINKDLMDVWYLPAAILLPPVYALVTPALIIALGRVVPRRHPLYRRVFSAAANGLTFGAASELAHGAAPSAAGHVIPPGVNPLSWVLIIAACELFAAVTIAVFLRTAVKTSAPGTRLLPILADPTTARYELAELGLGIAVTVGAAAYPLLALSVVPGAILTSRYLTARPTAPTAPRLPSSR